MSANFPSKSAAGPPPSSSSSSSAPSSSAPPPPCAPSSSSSSSATDPRTGAPRGAQVGRKSHKNHRKPNTPRYSEGDAGSPHTASRKGTSITHLMNWHVPTRPHLTDHQHQHQRRSPRRAPTWGPGSGYHAADKARFINANYRFLVHPRGDYRAQAVDADAHLPWDMVLQVLASAQTQKPSCPICLLDDPVAPRMARCGHVFCLPCLLRYMATSPVRDENGGGGGGGGDSAAVATPTPQHVGGRPERARKCVICMDAVQVSETRPVRFYHGLEGPAPPREGEEVILRLVVRRQGSTLALPVGVQEEVEEEGEAGVPWHNQEEVMEYARVMRGSEEYMQGQYEREIEELERMEREDEVMFGEDGEWTRKAVAAVKVARKGVKGMGGPPPPPLPSMEEKVDKKPPLAPANPEDIPEFYHHMHEFVSGHSTTSPATTTTATPEDTSAYYFYLLPPHHYLTPLDIRLLHSTYNTYAHFPPVLPTRLQTIIPQTITDDLRRRTKYLSHLPTGCSVSFLECDWSGGVVPEDVLQRFGGELERRRVRKVEKEGREERERVRAEREEERRVVRRTEGEGWGAGGEEWVGLTEAQEEVDGAEEEEGGGGKADTGVRTVWGTPVVGTPTVQEEAGAGAGQRQEGGGWQQGGGGWQELEREDLAARLGAPKKGRRKKKVTLMTNGGKRGA